LRRQEEEFACANIWKATWEKNGWSTVMLNNSHAKANQFHQKMIAKLLNASKQLPASEQNNFQPNQVRFSRLFALAAAGGGWLSNYDVVNKGFTASMATELERQNSIICAGNEKPHLVFMSSAIAFSLLQKILAEELVENGKLKQEIQFFSLQNENFPFSDKIIHVKSLAGEKKSENMKKIAES